MEEGKKKIVNVYHKNCLDGIGSACAVYEYATQGKHGLVQIAMAHNYSEVDVNDLLIEIKGATEIYFTDFSMKLIDMERMMKFVNEDCKVLVLDHHKGVEEVLTKLADKHDNFDYIFDNNKSGAALTWEHFWEGSVPKMIYNIEDRDLWRFKLPDTNIITAFLFEHIDATVEEFNRKLYSADAKTIGTVLTNKREKTIEFIYEQFKGKYLNLYVEGIGPVKVFNQYEYKSELGNKFSTRYNEAVGIFHIEAEKVGISFRSIDSCEISANEYAKMLGGNGHKNASGAWISLNEFLENITTN